MKAADNVEMSLDIQILLQILTLPSHPASSFHRQVFDCKLLKKQNKTKKRYSPAKPSVFIEVGGKKGSRIQVHFWPTVDKHIRVILVLLHKIGFSSLVTRDRQILLFGEQTV